MRSSDVIERKTAQVMRLLSGPLEEAIRSGADPVELAAVVTASMPSSFDAYGPFYDTSGVTRWLGISRQAVEKRAAARRMLAVKTSDGHVLYPAWQFDSTTRTVPRMLQEVLAVLLPAAESPWSVAAWLRTPVVDGGRDAIDSIRDGHGDEVLAEARRDAARWSQ